MIDVKAAVRIALDYLQEFQEFVSAKGARLEETEFDDAGYWLITLSTLEDEEGVLTTFIPTKRTYKRFVIDAKTGEVKSMKVRTLQPID